MKQIFNNRTAFLILCLIAAAGVVFLHYHPKLLKKQPTYKSNADSALDVADSAERIADNVLAESKADSDLQNKIYNHSKIPDPQIGVAGRNDTNFIFIDSAITTSGNIWFSSGQVPAIWHYASNIPDCPATPLCKVDTVGGYFEKRIN